MKWGRNGPKIVNVMTTEVLKLGVVFCSNANRFGPDVGHTLFFFEKMLNLFKSKKTILQYMLLILKF